MIPDDSIRPRKAYRKRRYYRWNAAARELVLSNRDGNKMPYQELLEALVTRTGYPRDVCRRFLKQMGVKSNRHRRRWSEEEKESLIELVEKGSRSVRSIAGLLQRSPDSVYAVLSRLGISMRVGQEWFSIRSLADALGVSSDRIKEWIKTKGLKPTYRKAGSQTWTLITFKDFAKFCKRHAREIVGNRLHRDRLQFLYQFVYAPSHAHLLPVRESKKERAAFEEQTRDTKGAGDAESKQDGDEEDEEDDETEGSA